MPKEYTQNQIDQAIEGLSDELKDALFSLETAEVVQGACEAFDVMDERGNAISKGTGYVLMGLMTPEEFQQEVYALGIEEPAAKEIARQINRFVFYPVKAALEQLHEMPAAKKPETEEGEAKTRIEQAKEAAPKEALEEHKGPDSYRETIE
ncbi:MAG: hypothetical protein Q8Q38_01410 [bacterium]|nr:hypothetical protein [bacterium]